MEVKRYVASRRGNYMASAMANDMVIDKEISR